MNEIEKTATATFPRIPINDPRKFFILSTSRISDTFWLMKSCTEKSEFRFLLIERDKILNKINGFL